MTKDTLTIAALSNRKSLITLNSINEATPLFMKEATNGFCFILYAQIKQMMKKINLVFLLLVIAFSYSAVASNRFHFAPIYNYNEDDLVKQLKFAKTSA